jgi:hypothetical protein
MQSNKKPMTNDEAILKLIQHMMGDKTYYSVNHIELEFYEKEEGRYDERVTFQYMDKYWEGRRDESEHIIEGKIPVAQLELFIDENNLREYCYDDWRNGGHYQEVAKTPMRDFLNDADCLEEAVVKYLNAGGRVW